MKDLFTKQDILGLKWKILLAVLCLMLAGGIYYYADIMNTQMARNLQIARGNLQLARTNIDQIEDEEATIIEYIGRYQELETDGVVNPEDRLQLIERITEIREDNDLFPISVNIGEQLSMELLYDQSEQDPGGPVNINSTTLELSLPLLHENDLTRLLDGLLNTPGLYMPQECIISLSNPNATNFIVLAQHQRANCVVSWFTFNVNPPQNNNRNF
ncbi:MAG: hypothetical protein CMP91_08015 [Gammaproteobacteria bacterium]|nr:hypothetical protein [Gammaproteobacteria bacterium]|tara:strand:- start:258287 stop:258931 length:645 start_codon:yes stop_codon:yes gene_type:complete